MQHRLRAASVLAFALSIGPAAAATITVTGTGDTIAVDGIVTLREAIASINGGSNVNADVVPVGTYGTADEIDFAISGAGVHTIAPASTLTITQPVFLNGYSQTGAAPNSNPLNAGINAVLLIELNGSAAANTLTVNGAGAVIRGLVLNHGDDEIFVGAANVTIAGNFLGTNPAGTAALPGSSGGFGVRIANNSANNTIVGGPAAADRNLISGDLQGGVIAGTNTGLLIQGNYIGTDVTGTLALGRPTAVGINNLNNASVIGNLISGNPNGGLFTEAPGNVVIQGNLIGTQRDGLGALGNGNTGVGVNGTGVLVGGALAGQANVIAFNNFGVNVTAATASSADRIQQNSIHDSTVLGISLTSGGTPLVNDACDPDFVFGNLGQNYPVITSALIGGGNVTISGTLNSTASTSYRVEFFSSGSCNASGNGEGQTFLGFADVATDGSCNAAFGPVAFAVPGGQTIITATATDPLGNTSEFSACVVAGGGGPTPTVTPTATTTRTPPPGSTSTPTVPVPTATPTVPRPTPTPNPGGAPTAIPMLSLSVLFALAAALAAAALLLLRRNG